MLINNNEFGGEKMNEVEFLITLFELLQRVLDDKSKADHILADIGRYALAEYRGTR